MLNTTYLQLLNQIKFSNMLQKATQVNLLIYNHLIYHFLTNAKNITTQFNLQQNSKQQSVIKQPLSKLQCALCLGVGTRYNSVPRIQNSVRGRIKSCQTQLGLDSVPSCTESSEISARAEYKVKKLRKIPQCYVGNQRPSLLIKYRLYSLCPQARFSVRTVKKTLIKNPVNVFEIEFDCQVFVLIQVTFYDVTCQNRTIRAINNPTRFGSN
eukprot:TRINITY_DN4117_c0_g1_i7.p2 TRINITY_DN4117_c0_g1~~TRINITY_DN4117_c0_g1_i7.p2  ORF type:complete len:211 (+),score=-16.20 TRINITY_DN4117_c0_g1_i7:905-1537(+)